MKAAPPLRFLALVVGGWLCVRVVTLVPGSQAEMLPEPPAPFPVAQAAASPQVLVVPPAMNGRFVTKRATNPAEAEEEAKTSTFLHHSPSRSEVAIAAVFSPPILQPKARASVTPAAPTPVGELTLFQPLPRPPSSRSRWSGSAWAFVRRGGAGQLAAGGLLGGSQVGGRVSYRLNRDAARSLALSARTYAPLASMDAAEIALGIEWKPLAALPMTLLAERRQAVGADGRSAFSLLAYGGVSDRPVAGPVRLDAYAQAGVVGLRARDLFADGAMRLTVPVDAKRMLKAGFGLWGAAQPGLSRLDVGPHISMRLPIRIANLRLAAEWRVRVAGNAAPASGPALTLSTDF
jgi:hypothetical protein